MPVPISGPGSVKEPFILKGNDLKCPNSTCGKTYELWQNQLVAAMQHILPLGVGDVEWGATEFPHEYDNHEPKDEPQYFCRACDTYFEAPDLFEEVEEKASA